MVRWVVDREDAEIIKNRGKFRWDVQSKECYDYAAAMMREKMRRDEMGNAKEANT